MDFPSHVNFPAEAREELIDLLNTCLASAIDLHWQVKQAHWNVRGRDFYSRHELFDEVADTVRKQADEFAERAGQLGGYAEGTIRLASKNSQLPEYDLQAVEGESHVRAVVDRVARYAALIRDGIRRCDDLDEPVTSDMLTGMLGDVEKYLWFLESHLYGEARGGRRGVADASVTAQPQ
jgi:starvation-inducible DNA-binding protein